MGSRHSNPPRGRTCVARVVIDFDDRGHAVNQLSFAQNRWSIRANKQAVTMAARRGQGGREGIKVLVRYHYDKMFQTCIVTYALRDVLR